MGRKKEKFTGRRELWTEISIYGKLNSKKTQKDNKTYSHRAREA